METVKTKRSFSQSFFRLLGLAQGLGNAGLAKRHTYLYKVLVLLGVLNKHPRDWEESEALGLLPWGSRALQGPKPALPAGFEGMWPQQSPLHPSFPPVILKVSREERRHHVLKNATRYLGQALGFTPIAAFKALFGTRLKQVGDARFNEIVGETCLAQFFSPLLDPREGARFAEDGDREIVVLDLSHLGSLQPLDGLFMSSSKAYFARVADHDYQVRAIALDEQLFGPHGAPASWQLAKYYLLMGLHSMLIHTGHPQLHFPNEVVNAISRTMLPQGHLLYRLIRPFTHFSLGLNQAVIHHRRSVYHNSQREMYNCFGLPSHEIMQMTLLGYHGEPDSHTYKPYHFGQVPKVASQYRAYLDDWYGHIFSLVSAVVAQIPTGDPFVRAWADQVAPWLPGFPNGEQVADAKTLEKAVTHYIMSVSVRHSADHFSYANIPLAEMPMRVRQEPPSLKTPKQVRLSKLVNREDYFRHQLAHAMFFKPVTLQAINKVKLEFENQSIKEAVAAFNDMKQLDKKWAGTRFPQSHQIASSIQY